MSIQVLVGKLGTCAARVPLTDLPTQALSGMGVIIHARRGGASNAPPVAVPSKRPREGDVDKPSKTKPARREEGAGAAAASALARTPATLARAMLKRRERWGLTTHVAPDGDVKPSPSGGGSGGGGEGRAWHTLLASLNRHS